MRCDLRTCSGNSHLLRNECVAVGRLLARPHRSSAEPYQKRLDKCQRFPGASLGLCTCSFLRRGIAQQHLAPGSIYEEYLRWGYPHCFHVVTGSLELMIAVLLAQARTRLWGSALGCTVMLAALATVTLQGECGHGVPPLSSAGSAGGSGSQLGMTAAVGGRENIRVRAFTGENLNIRVFTGARSVPGPWNEPAHAGWAGGAVGGLRLRP